MPGRRRRLLPPEVEAQEPGTGPATDLFLGVLHDVEEAAAHGGEAPGMHGVEELRARLHLRVLRREVHPEERAEFAKHEEFTVDSEQAGAQDAEAHGTPAAGLGVLPHDVLAPFLSAVLRIEADELGVVLRFTVNPIEEALVKHGCHPVRGKPLRPPGFPGLESRIELDHDAAEGPAFWIGGGDEHAVQPGNHGGSAADGLNVVLRAPGEAAEHGAVLRVEAEKTADRRVGFAAGIDEDELAPVHGGGHGRGIAGAPGVLHTPEERAGLQVKRTDTQAGGGEGGIARGAVAIGRGGFLAPDIHDDFSVEDERRAALAKEVLGHVKLLPQIALPGDAAGFEIEAGEHAGDPEGDDAAFSDDRRAARAVRETVAVAIADLVVAGPVALPRLRVQAFDRLPAIQRVEGHQEVAFDGGRGVAFSPFELPDLGRPLCGEVVQQVGFRGGGVVARAEEAAPVRRLCLRVQRLGRRVKGEAVERLGCGSLLRHKVHELRRGGIGEGFGAQGRGGDREDEEETGQAGS